MDPNDFDSSHRVPWGVQAAVESSKSLKLLAKAFGNGNRGMFYFNVVATAAAGAIIHPMDLCGCWDWLKIVE